MIALLLANWKLILIGLVVAAVGGYVLHCERAKTGLAASVAIAEQQQRENAKTALREQANKERSDENYARNISRLNSDLVRLRNARPGVLPAAAPGAANPDRACFDRTELSAALRNYREGVLGLVGEGATAVEGLDESKAWAKDRE